MRLKQKVVIIILLICLSFYACQQTPSITIINNEECETSSDVNSELITIDTIKTINIVTQDIDEIVEAGNNTVILNGVVSKPDSYVGLYKYSAEIVNYDEYEQNMLFLFGEYEELVHRNELTGKLTVRAEDGFWGDLYNIGLNYNNYTGMFGGIWFTVGEQPVTEELRKVDMSFEEAKSQANEILSKIGIKGIYYDCCVYNEEKLQITPEGTQASPLGDTLIVYYVQKNQGVPVRTTLINDRKWPITKVTFDSERVCDVWISEYLYKPYEKIDNCITYEDAYDIFIDYVGSDSKYNETAFNEVCFQYTITREYIDGKFVDVAIPYWFFNREDDPLLSWDNRGDVYINCIDGSVTEL